MENIIKFTKHFLWSTQDGLSSFYDQWQRSTSAARARCPINDWGHVRCFTLHPICKVKSACLCTLALFPNLNPSCDSRITIGVDFLSDFFFTCTQLHIYIFHFKNKIKSYSVTFFFCSAHKELWPEWGAETSGLVKITGQPGWLKWQALSWLKDPASKKIDNNVEKWLRKTS